MFCLELLAEVALQQAFESLAMAGFIAGHFMHGDMDGVQIQLLGHQRQIKLALGSAVLGVHAHFEVLLGGVGYDFAQQLGKIGGMFGFFVCSHLPVQADFGIAFAMGNAGHGQIHANLGALAHEVLTQALLPGR